MVGLLKVKNLSNMEMKYLIGQKVIVLNTEKLGIISAIDSEAGWYKLKDDSTHYSEEEIATIDEVLYTLIIHDSIYPEDKHSAILFNDRFKASNYMQDLFEGFDDPNCDRWIKEYNNEESFYIYNSEKPLECYSCEIKAVKIIE